MGHHHSFPLPSGTLVDILPDWCKIITPFEQPATTFHHSQFSQQITFPFLGESSSCTLLEELWLRTCFKTPHNPFPQDHLTNPISDEPNPSLGRIPTPISSQHVTFRPSGQFSILPITPSFTLDNVVSINAVIAEVELLWVQLAALLTTNDAAKTTAQHDLNTPPEPPPRSTPPLPLAFPDLTEAKWMTLLYFKHIYHGLIQKEKIICFGSKYITTHYIIIQHPVFITSAAFTTNEPQTHHIFHQYDPNFLLKLNCHHFHVNFASIQPKCSRFAFPHEPLVNLLHAFNKITRIGGVITDFLLLPLDPKSHQSLQTISSLIYLLKNEHNQASTLFQQPTICVLLVDSFPPSSPSPISVDLHAQTQTGLEGLPLSQEHPDVLTESTICHMFQQHLDITPLFIHQPSITSPIQLQQLMHAHTNATTPPELQDSQASQERQNLTQNNSNHHNHCPPNDITESPHFPTLYNPQLLQFLDQQLLSTIHSIFTPHFKQPSQTSIQISKSSKSIPIPHSLFCSPSLFRPTPYLLKYALTTPQRLSLFYTLQQRYYYTQLLHYTRSLPKPDLSSFQSLLPLFSSQYPTQLKEGQLDTLERADIEYMPLSIVTFGVDFDESMLIAGSAMFPQRYGIQCLTDQRRYESINATADNASSNSTDPSPHNNNVFSPSPNNKTDSLLGLYCSVSIPPSSPTPLTYSSQINTNPSRSSFTPQTPRYTSPPFHPAQTPTTLLETLKISDLTKPLQISTEYLVALRTLPPSEINRMTGSPGDVGNFGEIEDKGTNTSLIDFTLLNGTPSHIRSFNPLDGDELDFEVREQDILNELPDELKYSLQSPPSGLNSSTSSTTLHQAPLRLTSSINSTSIISRLMLPSSFQLLPSTDDTSMCAYHEMELNDDSAVVTIEATQDRPHSYRFKYRGPDLHRYATSYNATINYFLSPASQRRVVKYTPNSSGNTFPSKQSELLNQINHSNNSHITAHSNDCQANREVPWDRIEIKIVSPDFSHLTLSTTSQDQTSLPSLTKLDSITPKASLLDIPEAPPLLLSVPSFAQASAPISPDPQTDAALNSRSQVFAASSALPMNQIIAIENHQDLEHSHGFPRDHQSDVDPIDTLLEETPHDGSSSGRTKRSPASAHSALHQQYTKQQLRYLVHLTNHIHLYPLHANSPTPLTHVQNLTLQTHPNRFPAICFLAQYSPTQPLFMDPTAKPRYDAFHELLSKISIHIPLILILVLKSDFDIGDSATFPVILPNDKPFYDWEMAFPADYFTKSTKPPESVKKPSITATPAALHPSSPISASPSSLSVLSHFPTHPTQLSPRAMQTSENHKNSFSLHHNLNQNQNQNQTRLDNNRIHFHRKIIQHYIDHLGRYLTQPDTDRLYYGGEAINWNETAINSTIDSALTSSYPNSKPEVPNLSKNHFNEINPIQRESAISHHRSNHILNDEHEYDDCDYPITSVAFPQLEVDQDELQAQQRTVYHFVVNGFAGYLAALPTIHRCALAHFFSLGATSLGEISESFSQSLQK